MLKIIQHSWLHSKYKESLDKLSPRIWMADEEAWTWSSSGHLPTSKIKYGTSLCYCVNFQGRILRFVGWDPEVHDSPCCWVNWRGSWMAECTQWTRRWRRLWHCCGVDSADYQCSEGLQIMDDLVIIYLKSPISQIGACKLSKRWRLSWHHTGRYMMAYRGGKSNWTSPFSSLCPLSQSAM